MTVKLKSTMQKNKWIYPLSMVLVLLAVLLFIEFKRPYFFFQDDNRDYYLPYIVHNYRSLINGEFAFYNFYQSLGMPSFSLGQSQVFYPLIYFTTFLSDVFFNHYNATIDILVITHLLIGSIGTYALVTKLTDSKISAFFAGITWSLSSFVIFVSNSWLIISTVAAYMPWMFYFSFRSYQEPNIKNRIFAIAARLLLFYAGHIQFFVYAVIFEFFVMMLFICSENPKDARKGKIIKYIIQYAKEYIAVFFLAAPILFPMWHSANISFLRNATLKFELFAKESYDIKDMIKGLFYPFSKISDSYDSNALWRNTNSLGHIGYITLAILLVAIVDKYILKKDRMRRTKVSYTVFAAPAVFAMLWASSIVVQIIVYLIPVINRFRWPFKLALYMDFLLVVLAALILGDIFNRIKTKILMKKIIFGLLICVHIFNFIILYTIMPYKDFGEHHADNIPLNDVLVDEIDEGRLLPVNFETWEKTPNNDCEYYTVPTFGFNYGLLLGIDCFGGYEQMMPDDNFNATLEINDTGYFISDKGIPINYLRNAGVKYYLLANTDKWNAKDILESNGLVIKYEDDVRTLYYDNKAKSLVYLESEDNNLIEEVNRTTNTVSASVDLAEEDTIIFNYLYNSFFKAYLDGQETELLKINDMYMGININKGKHDIMIRYENPYFKWGIIAALGYLFAIYLWSILKKHQFFLAIKAK